MRKSCAIKVQDFYANHRKVDDRFRSNICIMDTFKIGDINAK